MSISRELVGIRFGPVLVNGMLDVPEQPIGLVLFAHGSGSGRLSPRNNYVAGALHEGHIATLLLDLLTQHEDSSDQMRFDIGLLTLRLDGALQWLRQRTRHLALPLGLFGASTGAAAALRLAAARPGEIAAVVARGGRPDLAGRDALERVSAPTLLIVGGLDDVVLRLNQAALLALHCETRMEIVPDATHLFEEPGKLEVVASLAGAWFARHFAWPPA